VLGELWVADAERSGLARIRLSAPTLAGTSTAVAEDEVMLAKDRAEYHYMPSVTSLAFDPLGQFATCQESVNVYDGNMQPNFFMGPTMYDTRERGWVSSKQEPCLEGETCFLVHVDMLHESPLCMGLVHDNAAVWTAANGQQYRNVYWAIGGGHSQLVRFDFESDHGPGSMDHSLASVRRYTGLKTTRVAGVPSHMVLDEAARLLYLADTGADRVVIVHTDTGRYTRDAKLNTSDFAAYRVYSSPLASFNYSVWDGLEYATFAKVPSPSGMALSPTTLYVGSYSEGAIYAFERSTGRLASVIPSAAPPNALLGLVLETTAHGAEGSLYYLTADDCASFNCTAGTCGATEVYIHTAALLTDYLDSDFYRNSFLHHGIHQSSMDHASYLNPYPIMSADFCERVGEPNATLGRPPNCAAIDYDALLLGGCFCHYCLLQVRQPCQHGSTCLNYNKQGYTCSCPSGFEGDHCQFESGAARIANLTSPFPWYQFKHAPPPPALPPPSPSSPEAQAVPEGEGQREATDSLALIIGLGVGGGVFLALAIAIGVYVYRPSAKAGTRTSKIDVTKSVATTSVKADSVEY